MLPLDFSPQKRKGQNFLIDNNIIAKIIKEVSLTKKSLAIEIGPGQGALTRELANHSQKVIAVELDKKLYNYLKPILKDSSNIVLINEDILEFNIAKFIKEKGIKQKITLVGNIPYSLTTPILEYVFQNVHFFDNIFLMVQKEFALRLMAKPNSKDYSSISCFAQFYTNIKILFSVKKTCFRPMPKVDSCFIKLEPKQPDFWKDELKPKDIDLLFKIIRIAFNQRRKTILNSLSKVLDKNRLSQVLIRLAVNENKRAENLTLEDFIQISNLCFDYFDSSIII